MRVRPLHMRVQERLGKQKADGRDGRLFLFLARRDGREVVVALLAEELPTGR